jgi:hypothetical protein
MAAPAWPRGGGRLELRGGADGWARLSVRGRVGAGPQEEIGPSLGARLAACCCFGPTREKEKEFGWARIREKREG